MAERDSSARRLVETDKDDLRQEGQDSMAACRECNGQTLLIHTMPAVFFACHLLVYGVSMRQKRSPQKLEKPYFFFFFSLSFFSPRFFFFFFFTEYVFIYVFMPYACSVVTCLQCMPLSETSAASHNQDWLIPIQNLSHTHSFCNTKQH